MDGGEAEERLHEEKDRGRSARARQAAEEPNHCAILVPSREQAPARARPEQGRQRVRPDRGEMLAVLEARQQLQNTVFVFTSDEGYFYGEHGLSVERRLA